MKIMYEFCSSHSEQEVLQLAEPFFKAVQDVMRIELLTYFPERKQFVTYHEGFPSTRYWDATTFSN